MDSESTIRFTANFTPDDIQRFNQIRTDSLNRHRFVTEDELGFYKEHTLTNDETDILNQVLSTALAKSTSLGISNPQMRLPTAEQVIVFDFVVEGDEVGGRVGEFGEYLQIAIPESMEFTDSQVAATLYHEISHFTNRRVVGKKGDTYKAIAHGFTRESLEEFKASRGLFDEPLATLFSLYCLDTETVVKTPYRVQLPFMVSLIKAYAQKAGKDFIHSFADFYKAYEERDFSFQRTLVDLFGIDFVREINNIKSIPFFGVKQSDTERIAEIGGFKKSYLPLQESFNNGEILNIEQMRGGFLKTSREME